jgi:hypothetical protein
MNVSRDQAFGGGMSMNRNSGDLINIDRINMDPINRGQTGRDRL